jgi:hypothetical protein
VEEEEEEAKRGGGKGSSEDDRKREGGASSLARGGRGGQYSINGNCISDKVKAADSWVPLRLRGLGFILFF